MVRTMEQTLTLEQPLTSGALETDGADEAGGPHARWHLSGFPNYRHALPVDEISASKITEKEFLDNYVNRNRPCVLKGAVRHWPAFTRWRQIDYLTSRTANQKVEIASYPGPELIAWAEPKLKKTLLDDVAATHREMPLHDFLNEVPRQGDYFVLPACPIEPGSPMAQLEADIGGYRFLPSPKRALLYTPYRAFIYRDSYTDWHFHSTDETLMTQVVGDKEVLILPPDNASWQALLPVIRENGYLFDVDTHKFPQFGQLQPIRAIVEEGDALYIPVFWWHAVQSLGAEFGITVASTFMTPLHINGDLRFPAMRKLFGTYIRTRHAPLLLAMVAYSLGYRMVQRFLSVLESPRRV